MMTSGWYFAIGSMINPVSLQSRELYPSASLPAEILDHRIYFYGSSGMAEAIPERGSSFHGVLHNITTKEQEFLDGIERDLSPSLCQCRLYDGALVDGCLVYTRPVRCKTNGNRLRRDMDYSRASQSGDPSYGSTTCALY